MVCGAAAGLLSFIFGELDMLFTALLVCIVTDYITGVLAALYEKRLNSEVGFRGIIKKVVTLLIVVLAHMIENAAGVTGTQSANNTKTVPGVELWNCFCISKSVNNRYFAGMFVKLFTKTM